MRQRHQKRRSGFTLIEVLLVAGILAVLAAFAIPSLFGQATKAKIELGKAGVGRNGPIAKALESYKWDMGKYPDTDEGIESLMKSTQEADDERVQAIAELFARSGYEATDAFIRARIIYFTQVGYYALGIREALEQRFQYLEAYFEGFTGQTLDPDIAEAHRAKHLGRRRR